MFVKRSEILGMWVSEGPKLSEALKANSFVPPPAGNNPTPTSTKPMYDSAAAIAASECIAISQPPPRVIPCGAETTGIAL